MCMLAINITAEGAQMERKFHIAQSQRLENGSVEEGQIDPKVIGRSSDETNIMLESVVEDEEDNEVDRARQRTPVIVEPVQVKDGEYLPDSVCGS